MTKNSAPAIILVRPQMGENIGAVARAMSNFGLDELRITAPRDGWPNEKAYEMAASGAGHILDNAKIYTDFPAALSGIHLAYATSARPRDMEKRVISPREACLKIHAQPAIRCALVFGPERSGLFNDDIALCDTLITIPTAAENPSLNIAQSAVVLGYEWHACASSPARGLSSSELAPKEEMLALFSQLEGYLDAADYFRVAHKKPIMWRNMQSMLLKGSYNSQEIRTFRGMIRSLWGGSRKQNS